MFVTAGRQSSRFFLSWCCILIPNPTNSSCNDVAVIIVSFLSQTRPRSWWPGLTWYFVSHVCLGCLHSWPLVSLFCRVKELKRAREHETPQRSPLAMWHHPPDSPFSFLFVPKTFYKRNEKRNINANTAITTTTAVSLVLLLIHVQQHFSHIYSSHWLDFGWRVATSMGL